MKAKKMSIGVLLTLLASTSVLGDLPKTEQAKPVQTHEDRLRFPFSVGLVYAPAPWLHGSYDDEQTNRKLLDQYGTRLALDGRLLRYLMLGGFFGLLGNEGTHLIEVGIRLGVSIPISRNWNLHGFSSLGVTSFTTNKDDHIANWSKDFIGWNTGLTFGFRHRISNRCWLFSEVSGVFHRLQEMSDNSAVEVFPQPSLYRIEFITGMTFDWTTGNH